MEIVRSSTVYPFSTVVTEDFGKETQSKTPKIESTGSRSGMTYYVMVIELILQISLIISQNRKIRI